MVINELMTIPSIYLSVNDLLRAPNKPQYLVATFGRMRLVWPPAVFVCNAVASTKALDKSFAIKHKLED